MYEYVAFTLWALGALFILCIFESDDDQAAKRLILLSIIWPLYSLYLVFLEVVDIFKGDDE